MSVIYYIGSMKEVLKFDEKDGWTIKDYDQDPSFYSVFHYDKQECKHLKKKNCVNTPEEALNCIAYFFDKEMKKLEQKRQALVYLNQDLRRSISDDIKTPFDNK